MKQAIESLINFEIRNEVIKKRDYTYVKNQLYNLLKLELSNKEIPFYEIKYPSDALDKILDVLEKDGTIEGIIERDLFDSKIMNIFTKLPSVIEDEFYKNLNEGKDALKTLYNYVTSLNYVRKNRTDKNTYFKKNTKYGELEITINVSKPEKDPKSILLASKQKQSSYPTCVLCMENEGFAGNFNRESRDQHRLIGFDLLDEKWFLQFSPYSYYNEHAIVFTEKHKPMNISEETFIRLLNLTKKFPNYFFGSNADLPIVGGSILSHEHYQGGRHTFPIENAKIIYELKLNNAIIEIVNWPLSTVRIKSNNIKNVVKLSSKLLNEFKKYNNPDLEIISHSNGISHNTITPIARNKNGIYEIDLILRNNRTNENHPSGIFHPHSDKWNIKKENIGLIEAIGLAILPARLKNELVDVKNYLLEGKSLENNSLIHLDWANSFKDKVAKENIDEIIEEELANTFANILEDAGIFKLNELGKKEFIKFVEGVYKNEAKN